jgi:hypothetical protein
MCSERPYWFARSLHTDLQTKMHRSFFAYHLTHFFGPFGLESYHTNSEAPTEGDFIYVVSGDDADDGGKDYALEGLFKIHRRHRGPFKLKSTKGQSREFMYRLSLIPVRMPPSPIAMRNQDWYERSDVHRYFSSGQNFNPVNPKYREWFDQLLVMFGSAASEISEDLEALVRRQDVDATTREALVEARIGQGRFRRDLVALWGRGEVCALTGIDVPELLIASHIKPWRDSDDRERLDPCNGLLLAAHVDKAFDCCLLGFREERGELIVSLHPRVSSAMKQTGVVNGRRLAVSHMNLSEGRRFSTYLNGHYQQHLALVERDRPTGSRSGK